MTESQLHLTLGVSHDDSESAVRHAYRDLTRECRPVTNSIPDHVRAIERAFEILGDRARRARYRTGRLLRPAPRPRGLEPIDLLADFEGDRPSRDEVWSAFRSNFEASGPPKSGRITALTIRIRVGRDQPLPDLAVPVFRPCPACHGLGSVDAWACDHCDASGLEEDRAQLALPTPDAGGSSARVEGLELQALGVLTPVLRVCMIGA